MSSMNINGGPPPQQARTFSRNYSSNQQQFQHHHQQQYQVAPVRRPSLDAGGRYQHQTLPNKNAPANFRFDDNFDQQVPVRKPSLDYTGRYHPPTADFPAPSKHDFHPFAPHDEL